MKYVSSICQHIREKHVFSHSVSLRLLTLQVLGVQLVKHDELECLIHGIHYVNSLYLHECYYWNNLHCIEKAEKVPYDFEVNPYPYLVVNIGSGVSILAVESADKFSRVTGTRYSVTVAERNYSNCSCQ